jgi:hypothetical protein
MGDRWNHPMWNYANDEIQSWDAGDTPLHSVAGMDRATDVVRLLIAKGAEINATNNEGDTPLHLAAQWACEKNVQLLIAEGADLNLKNLAGDTPLDSAIRQWTRQVEGWEQGEWKGSSKRWHQSIGEWERCIELLRRHGAKTASTTWPQEKP